MNIEIIIFIYIYICICVVIFDLIFVIRVRYSDWILEKRAKDIINKIRMQIYTLRIANKCDDAIQEFFKDKLCKVSYLMAFEKAVKKLRHTDDLNLYFNKNIDIFSKIASKYLKDKNENKAYFCYMLYTLNLGERSKSMTIEEKKSRDLLADIINYYIRSESIYVRENSFKAILSMGNHQKVVDSLNIINRDPNYQMEKLLADGLVTFNGEHKLLVEELFRTFDDFSIVIQVAIVNYLRLLKDKNTNEERYYKKLYFYLINKDSDKELKLAIIRYFRKYTYEPALDTIIDLVKNENIEFWELSAVSASTLESYPCDKTIDALKSAIGSSNWYIRFNAAESLIKMGIDCKELIENNEDNYAKEMIEYRNDVNKLKGETM